jgi:hypothetical protein
VWPQIKTPPMQYEAALSALTGMVVVDRMLSCVLSQTAVVPARYRGGLMAQATAMAAAVGSRSCLEELVDRGC